MSNAVMRLTLEYKHQYITAFIVAKFYFVVETDVISGNENSSKTCSWSSTTYTPVQLTAMITSFLGRVGPLNLYAS